MNRAALSRTSPSTFDDLFGHVEKAFWRMHAAGGRRLPRTKIQAAQFLQILYDLRLAPLAMDDLGSAAAQRRGVTRTAVAASSSSAQNIAQARLAALRSSRTSAASASTSSTASGGASTAPSNALAVKPPAVKRRETLHIAGDGYVRTKTNQEVIDRFLGPAPVRRGSPHGTKSRDAEISAPIGAGRPARSGSTTERPVDAEHGRKSAKRAEQSQLFRVDVLGQAGAPASSNERLSMPEILDLMIRRGYYSQSVEKKRDSAGPGRPPKMSLEDCKRWASFFYLQKLKRYERQQPAKAPASKACATTSEPAREDPIRAPHVAENAHTGKVEELPTEDREVANSKRRRGRGLGELGPRLRALLHANKTRDPAPLVGVIKKKQHSRRYRKRPNEQPRSMF